MKKTISYSNFVDEFLAHGRKDQFSYDGKRALFDYLEQLESDLVEEIELDVVALCCEYTEFEDINEYNSQYNQEFASIDELEDAGLTTVIRVGNNGLIIQDY